MNTSSRLRTFWLACAVSGVFAVLLLATSSSFPLVWDEGDTIVRAETILRAAEQSGVDGHPRFLEAVQSTANWPYTTVREGDPPLAGVLIALGSWLAPESLDPPTRARLAPILLFSLAAGAMFYRLQRDYQVWAVSVVAVATLATMPRVFAHAHFATMDGPLTACWILAWATFGPACRDWRWSACFGIALGLTLCTKFSGWLAVPPFAVWAMFFRDRSAWRALAIGLPIGIAVFVALNPVLWAQPLDGLLQFFKSNLFESGRPRLNLSTQFFGQSYTTEHPLPWYGGLVWAAITVSPMTLVFGCAGIVTTLRRWRDDPASTLLICQWATLIVARAFPLMPPHDAERLILPSFAFFAALVGVGIGRAQYRASLLKPEKIVAQGWAKVALAIVLAAATFDAVSYFPHNLSYYNRLIGGLRGAAALGMEPTYYWDSLDRDALNWLAEHTKKNERVVFNASSPRNLELLARWGLLDYHPDDTRHVRWYVMQHRPGAWRPWDKWLTEHDQPAYEHSFAGVPLLSIYPNEAAIRARATAPR